MAGLILAGVSVAGLAGLAAMPEEKKLLEDLYAKLESAEIEVEKAAIMTAPIGAENADGIKETASTLVSAQSQLHQTLRLIDCKLKTMEEQKGPVYEEVKVLQEWAKTAQKKLDEVRKDLKEQQVRMAAEQLLREVSEKVCNAEDKLQRMSATDMAFTQGNANGAELDTLMEEAENVASTVHAALADAQTFLAKKLVEIARFSEGQAKAVVKEELAGLQDRLKEGSTRLQQFKAGSADRKRTHLLQEVEEKVTSAEAEMQLMKERTSALANIGSAGEAVPESLKQALEFSNQAERTAQASIAVARKALLQKTAELNKLAFAGAGSGSELGNFQTRVNYMQQEIARMKNATQDAEERVRVKQMLAEVVMRLQATEVEVDKVAASAVPFSTEEPPAAEDVERIDEAAASVKTKLSAIGKLIDVKLKSAAGLLRDELQGMRARAAQAEQKLAGVTKAASEQKERMRAAEIVAQTVEKVEKAEETLQQMSEAELPFLKGIEELASSESADAITACEKAAAKGQKAIADAHTFIVQKLTEIKENFSNVSAKSCTKELTELQKRLDAGAGKLAELKKDTTERKRKSQMQASAENISAKKARLSPDDGLIFVGGKRVKGVEDVVASAEAKVAKVVESIKSRNADTLQKDLGAGELEDIKLSADDAMKTLADAKALINSAVQAQEGVNGASKSAMLQVRFTMPRLLSRASSAETMCKILVEPARTAYDRVVGALLDNALTSFRAAVQRLGKDLEELFDEFAGGQGELSSEQFATLFEQLPNHGLSKDDIALLYRSLSSEKLTKRVFVSTVQEDAEGCAEEEGAEEEVEAEVFY